jgi:hypothetical protein
MSYNFDKEFPLDDPIWKWSDPRIVNNRAKHFYHASVRLSDRPSKKYKIWDPIKSKWVYFGAMHYEDYTKHRDTKRRNNYLTRSAGIHGNWADNIYSPNNLSRILLW